jgi:hypothetical protein
MGEFPKSLPHDDIKKIGDGVYWVRGSAVMGPGMRIPRNMAIVVHDGEVTVIGAVRLSPTGEARLAELGELKHVVKIGYFHGMDDAYYLSKYGADYWTLPDGARDIDPTPTETLTHTHLPFPDSELFAFENTVSPEGALLVKRSGGILVTCDAVQNWPDTSGCSLAAKLVVRVMGFTRRPAQIGPPWRKHMTPEGGTLQTDFERLAGLKFDKLIGGHGIPLKSGAQQALAATVAATFD